jgi:hypothetical protein
VGVVLLAGPATAAAGTGQVDEVLQELFLGEAVYPQDAGELQVTAELGAGRLGGPRGRSEATGGLLVELGLTERLQLAARAPVAWVDADGERAAGLGNASVEAMYNPLSDRARGLAVSAGIEVSLPAPSRVGEDAWGVEGFAVAYKVLGRVHANLTVGVELELPRGAGTEREVAVAGALGVFAPIGRWVPVLEVRVDAGAEPAATMAAGALWHPAGSFELGAAVQLGLDARSIGGFMVATVELDLSDDDSQ